MAAQSMEYMSIGWDTSTEQPICSVLVTYDDQSMRLQSIRGINRSVTESFSFWLLNESQPNRNQTMTLGPGDDRSFSIPANRQPTINPETGEVDGYSLQLSGAPYRLKR